VYYSKDIVKYSVNNIGFVFRQIIGGKFNWFSWITSELLPSVVVRPFPDSPLRLLVQCKFTLTFCMAQLIQILIHGRGFSHPWIFLALTGINWIGWGGFYEYIAGTQIASVTFLVPALVLGVFVKSSFLSSFSIFASAGLASSIAALMCFFKKRNWMLFAFFLLSLSFIQVDQGHLTAIYLAAGISGMLTSLWIVKRKF
jgi:hypothetical protein